ncbi:putative nucleotide-diphospho-sugar transferase [Actibacterium sp.]|uniref:putative nucleotide-diphospho-sugar transferase n=1 Tax=Actibacterium sp. TaxID=1872125 RepID=UPI00356280D9
MTEAQFPVWPEQIDPATDDRGFVFGASGEKYAALAVQAAQSLRTSNPGVAIDLYTDCPVPDGVFDQVHPLEKSWFRPKFEALLRSRFQRTIYLDVDLVVIADLSDAFWLLNRFDVSAAHVQNRNMPFATRTWRVPLPNSFPQINSGVMGVRKNERTKRFLTEANEALAEQGLTRDQPILRELLWLHDVSLAIMPEEYNWRKHERIYTSNWTVPAPRVLHSSRFHRKMDGLTPPPPEKVYGRFFMFLVRNLIRGDRQLSSDSARSGWFWRLISK